MMVLNLQDLVNGVDWIRDTYRGKLCIELDIDRQNITVFGTPAEVDALVRYPAEANALNVRLRRVLVEVDVLTHDLLRADARHPGVH